VFRSIERPEYAEMVCDQLVAANAKGPGDLQALLHSGATWTVE
jgi:2-oxoglutarate ferredoxin oxidoreductase subunit beta